MGVARGALVAVAPSGSSPCSLSPMHGAHGTGVDEVPTPDGDLRQETASPESESAEARVMRTRVSSPTSEAGPSKATM